MKNRFFVIFRDNKMLISINDQSNLIEYSFKDLKTYPNIPFYVNIFDTDNMKKKIKPIVYENLNTLSEKIFKPEIYILAEDDTMSIEKRLIDDFMFTTLAPKKVFFVDQCVLLTSSNIDDYISISKSCRMFILSYIKSNHIIAQKFIDKKDYSSEELNKLINSLHDDCKSNKIDIFLNGTHLKKYSHMGKIIDTFELLENAQKLFNK
ncbi:hypothetical protein [Oceanirhabdus sp. W0125-5]|uniref:hypothetical protein n=1 Tax=Oceanirhabdus sp. W0125-5 TaxID=2999116 RepID=UPI0022F30D01|nr:hypothetical protein [Oceanirhabdus sp. W0125-5]WBW94939.1 hypothetical protein OW730_14675 [Oceanirhabdus sp. W0125-5]